MRTRRGGEPLPDVDPFDSVLRQLELHHLRRRVRPLTSPCGTTVTIDGRSVILMASNDYLGLANHPSLKRAAVEATEQFGVGAGASRLISGTLPPHVALEKELARFKGADAAVLFGSGYLANLGVLPAVAGTGDLLLVDRLCHASVIDGCRLSRATLRVFRHGDMEHLERLLARRAKHRGVLVVTEGIFSMDGDASPLPELVRLTRHYGARLFVDDAHGTGIMGAHGRGTLEFAGVAADGVIQMGTLGKALGSSGAFVVGSEGLREYLINRARSFIYSTAPPPASAAAALAALTIVQTEPDRRARLWANREYLLKGLRALGFQITRSVSPIIPVLIGQPDQALEAAELLFEHGVFAPAIRPPTVPKGTSRIRLTVTSEHSGPHLDQVLAAFQLVGQRLKLTA